MDGFKTLRREASPVSAGDRVGGRPLTLESAGSTETVNVTGEAPLIQAQAASARSPSPPRRSRTCRSPTATSRVAALAPGVDRAERDRDRGGVTGWAAAARTTS